MACGLRFIIGKVRGREFEEICGNYDPENGETYLCEKCRNCTKDVGGSDE